MNFLFRSLYDWILYVKDAIFVADSGSVKAGIDATGDGASPGGKFTPGGGGTPARGAASLTPQAAPSAPSNGDFWTTAAGVFARAAGTTVELGLLVFEWVTNPPNTAGTTTFCWAGIAQAAVAAPPAASAVAQTTHLVPRAGVVRSAVIKVAAGVTSGPTSGGSVTVTLVKNGVPTSLAVTVPAGTAVGAVLSFSGTPPAVALGDVLDIQVVNGAGLVTGITTSQIEVLLALG
jgi:hypothetical protein